MRKINWSDAKMGSQIELIKLRSIKQLKTFLDLDLKEGEMYDSRTKKVRIIKEAEDHVLERMISFISRVFKSTNDPEIHDILLNKQKEIELEQSERNQE